MGLGSQFRHSYEQWGRLDGTIGLLRPVGPVVPMVVGASAVLNGLLTLGAMFGLSALGAGFLDPAAVLATGMKLSQLQGTWSESRTCSRRRASPVATARATPRVAKVSRAPRVLRRTRSPIAGLPCPPATKARWVEHLIMLC